MADNKSLTTKGKKVSETVKPVSKWVRISRDIHEQSCAAQMALLGEKVKQNAKLMQLESSLNDAKDKLAIIEAILTDKKLEAIQLVFKRPAQFTVKTEWLDVTPKNGTTYVFTPQESMSYAE